MKDRHEDRVHAPSSTSVVAVGAMLVAMLALVFSLGGFAGAAGPKAATNDVELLTIATGSLEVAQGATSGDEQVTIPLTNATFTQTAGDTVLVVAELSSVPSSHDAFCDISNVAIGSAPDLLLQNLFLEPAGVGSNRQTEALAPIGVTTARTLEAKTGYNCSGSENVSGLTINVKIAVLALR